MFKQICEPFCCIFSALATFISACAKSFAERSMILQRSKEHCNCWRFAGPSKTFLNLQLACVTICAIETYVWRIFSVRVRLCLCILRVWGISIDSWTLQACCDSFSGYACKLSLVKIETVTESVMWSVTIKRLLHPVRHVTCLPIFITQQTEVLLGWRQRSAT